MAHVDHSDWMFEHSGHHLAVTHVDPNADVATDTSHLIQPDSVASVLKTLWHHTDLMSGGISSAQTSNASANSTTAGNIVAPTLTVGSNALTVDAGGSVALPITVSSAGKHTSVTISGLASYESVTDALDHQTFSGNSITLTAAQVNSGLSLASDYAGSDHPVNTLSVTATEVVGHSSVTSAAQTIVVTDPPVVTTGSAATTGAAGTTSTSGNPLTLQVSGDMFNGDPQIQVFVDGQQVGNASYDITAHHSLGQTQTIQIAGNFDPTVAHQVQVKFINDAWDGTSAADGHDRNVYVSSISLNGTTMNGVQGTGDAIQGPVGNEAEMNSNGTLAFHVPADPPATGGTATGTGGSNPLTLQVSGDMFNGDPQIQVFVDGQQVGNASYDITAHHSLGQTQTIQIAGNFDPTVAHQVQVKFINDAWDGTSAADGHDRNVYVSSISLNGTTLNGIQGTGADASSGSAALMHSNGTFSFNVPADPPATGSNGTGAGTGTGTGTSGTNPLTLQVSGDMFNGDPQIQVFVDGQQVGNASYDITAHHSLGQTQTIQIAGNFNPTVAHQVQVKFINDAWDGTSAADGHDRNVYVSSISLNGTTMNGVQGVGADSSSGIAALMYSNGTLILNVPADPPAGSGGTAVGVGAGAPPSGPGFYVSPSGNDSNPGTEAAPFATLARAQQAMENSSIKATYVEGGTYHLSSAISLTGADSGETWQYYPASGVDTAVLDGGNSTGKGFDIHGASNVTINGLKFQNFVTASIEAYTSPGTVIENNDVGFMTVTPPVENAGAVIGISVGDHVTVKNNYVHDISSVGIASYAYDPGSSNDGTVISGNVVLRTVLKSSDDGAIYVNDKSTGASGGHVTISNNFVGQTGGAGYGSVRDIYLDDNASNVTVSGNVLGPMAAGVAVNGGNFNAVFVHNGSNNTISGNVIDLGSSSFMDIATWGYDGGSLAGMANSVFTNNVVLSNFTGGNHADYGYGNYAYLEAPGGQASWFTVANNVYWNNASGGQVFYNGNFTNDTNPVVENPQIAGPTYTMAQNSPVHGSINFSPIVGGWGPAGFVIPA